LTMQYFASDGTAALKGNLLFYLVTLVFAQPVSRFDRNEIAIELRVRQVRGRTRPDVLWVHPSSAL
jgi:hypothetical protein